MHKPVLHLIQCQTPAHRGREPRCFYAVRSLHPVLAEVDRERVTPTRFHEPEPLSLGHAPKPVFADLSACIHARKRTTRDARRYTGRMVEDTLALPVELLGNVERYAVYRCYSGLGELLYIGETGELGARLASHAQKLWFVQVRGITLEWYADELDALKAERRAIHVEHPKYNKQHRGTTSLQVARTKTRQRAATAKRPAGDGEATRRAAIQVLRAEPGISGGDLGRRIGKTPRYGQILKNKLAGSVTGGD